MIAEGEPIKSGGKREGRPDPFMLTNMYLHLAVFRVMEFICLAMPYLLLLLRVGLLAAHLVFRYKYQCCGCAELWPGDCWTHSYCQ